MTTTLPWVAVEISVFLGCCLAAGAVLGLTVGYLTAPQAEKATAR